ncbi:transcription initiation factor TFIID subunit 5 [Patella vulgata]|uniref:transcription initiation factor TFIID subunit 5 n=1 Tax=Patella vulgata TaxID=6465 RepID=UPI002180601E|nr:transcription initiation factor TFIID subunit 5 [Patella vulgata]
MEAMEGIESGKAPVKPDISEKQTLLAVLQFLKKHNLAETESQLKREAKLTDDDVATENSAPSESEVSHALAAYKSDDDPTLYGDIYTDLKAFVDSSLDVHKVELAMVLYPVFVHMYLELVYNGHESTAKSFFEKFSKDQEDYHQTDISKLATVTKPEHMKGNQLMENFKASKFVIRMSRDSYTHLKRHLQDKQLNLLLNIIQEHLFIDVFDGVPRNKQQIQLTCGGILGEAQREANKAKVFYGLLKEPDINVPLEEEEDPGEGDSSDKPKKKKSKKDPLLMKKSKNDPNAPVISRIPLPEIKDMDKIEKINMLRESSKKVKVDKDHPPSICFYTFLNSAHGVTCIDISEDASLISAGFADSAIRVHSIVPGKLRSVKTGLELELIDKDADDVLERMMDDKTGGEFKRLSGHSGPVYSTCFSSDRTSMISSSEDGTIRLWSLQTWSNLVCFKGHNYPVWDVKFSPHGHYFASAGHDRTARLWSTDHYQPMRIFAGHLSDVDCLQFHPNSNYIATGSSDRTVRLWDVLNGGCVRIFTGHKSPVHCLGISPDGKYLASSGVDQIINLWDISTGSLVSQMKGHTDTVYTLAFSRDGGVLASGGLDNTVRTWDMNRVIDEMDTDVDASIPSTLQVVDNSNLLLGTYYTKASPVLSLQFTRKNLLLAGGAFVAS